ncbi:hypothetical protein HNQ02_003478 [Flavobacterium sp. 7E]|nr:hypothetical protein [Flavobacterium sp. 7E]
MIAELNLIEKTKITTDENEINKLRCTSVYNFEL